MALKRILLGTTALLTAGNLAASLASAAEVKPLGALDISLGGYSRWYTFLGDVKEKTQRHTGSYAMRNDNEFYVFASNTDEATGIVYGTRLQFNADSNGPPGTDEMFVFIRGKFGEFRFGDKDGPADSMKLGAFTIAAFSGGLDGVGSWDSPALVNGADSGDQTKVMYYTPVLAGFQAGVGFSPHIGSSQNGQNMGQTNDGGPDDWLEGGLAYTGAFPNVSVLASITGGWGHFNGGGAGGRDAYLLYGGSALTLWGFKLAGGIGYEKGARPLAFTAGSNVAPTFGLVNGSSNGNYIGGVTFARDASYSWFNVGAAYAFGPANVSINYGKTINTDTEDGFTGTKSPQPYAVILGVDVGVAPGLVVGGEAQKFEGGDGNSSNDGYIGLVGVRLAF